MDVPTTWEDAASKGNEATNGLLTPNLFMAIKAVAVDDENTEHLIIGLNRDNINDLLDGDVFTLPRGMAVTLTEKSDIVLLFAETDEGLERRFPARLRPI